MAWLQTQRLTVLVNLDLVVLFYFILFIFGMSAYIVCTEERKRDVNYVPNELKQKLQYRVQCVKERSYSTAPITSAINMHNMCTPTLTERGRAREGREAEKEREREQERDEKRRKRENTNTMYG